MPGKVLRLAECVCASVRVVRVIVSQGQYRRYYVFMCLFVFLYVKCVTLTFELAKSPEVTLCG